MINEQDGTGASGRPNFSLRLRRSLHCFLSAGNVSTCEVLIAPLRIFYGGFVWLSSFGRCSDVFTGGVKGFVGPAVDVDHSKRYGFWMGILVHLALASWLCRLFGSWAPDPYLFLYLWSVLLAVVTALPLFGYELWSRAEEEFQEAEVLDPGFLAAKLKADRFAAIANSKSVREALAEDADFSSGGVRFGAFELIEGVLYGAKLRPVNRVNSPALKELGIDALAYTNEGVVLIVIGSLRTEGEIEAGAAAIGKAIDDKLYAGLAEAMGWRQNSKQGVAGWIVYQDLPGDEPGKKPSLNYRVQSSSIKDLLALFGRNVLNHKEYLTTLTTPGQGSPTASKNVDKHTGDLA